IAQVTYDRETNILIRTVNRRIRMPLLFCFAQLVATAQQQTALTMPEAVQRALDKYPAVRSSMEQVSAAAAGINLADKLSTPSGFSRSGEPRHAQQCVRAIVSAIRDSVHDGSSTRNQFRPECLGLSRGNAYFLGANRFRPAPRFRQCGQGDKRSGECGSECDEIAGRGNRR